MAVWPPLPIVIGQRDSDTQTDHIITAFEHNDRICQNYLSEVSEWQLEEVSTVMQEPYPVLTDLAIWLIDWDDYELWEDGLLEDEPPLVVPESFLGGSAPHLQHLQLEHVPHIQDYRIYFCPPLALSVFTLRKFLIPDTFPPMR